MVLGFRVKGRVTKLWKLPKDTKARLLEDWFESETFRATRRTSTWTG